VGSGQTQKTLPLPFFDSLLISLFVDRFYAFSYRACILQALHRTAAVSAAPTRGGQAIRLRYDVAATFDLRRINHRPLLYLAVTKPIFSLRMNLFGYPRCDRAFEGRRKLK
jgi:hypothetical protein